MLPFARKLGYSIPPFDFSVPVRVLRLLTHSSVRFVRFCVYVDMLVLAQAAHDVHWHMYVQSSV